MPEVQIYNLRDSKLDGKVKYDFGDETLLDILQRYGAEKFEQYRVAIGGYVFKDLKTPIEICLEYGDSILIFDKESPNNKSGMCIYIKTLTGRTITLTGLQENMTIEEIRLEIERIEGIPYEQQRLLFSAQQLKDYTTLYENKIQNKSVLHLILRLRGGGIPFADITKDGEVIPFGKGLKWRVASFGLNLESRCQNRACEAYGHIVIMQMSHPIIYKVGLSHNDETCCPMCKKYVKPETCAFFNCSYRFLGIMETTNGPTKYKSDWKEIGNSYYRYNADKKVEWISLVIETKVRDDDSSLTTPISCGFCLTKCNINLTKMPNCGHMLHIRCIDILKTTTESTICPQCRVIGRTV